MCESILACLDSWPSASCTYVVENELCDPIEFKSGTITMKLNYGENCLKTCGHCGKNPTDKYDLCFIIKSMYLSIFAYNDISLFSLHQFKRITRLLKANIAFGVKTIEANGLIVP